MSATVSLLDESGKLRAALGLMGHTPELRVSDRQGQAFAKLTIHDDETEPWPELLFGDREGWRIMLVVAHDGLPHLTFYDRNSTARLHLTLDQRGYPHVEKYRSSWLARKFWWWKWYGYYPRKNVDSGF
jgi:hypothetical protein